MATDATEDHKALKKLLEYRITTRDRTAAAEEMAMILCGSHSIWKEYSTSSARSDVFKQTILGFLAHFFKATQSYSQQGGQESSSSLVSVGSLTVLNSDFDFRGGASVIVESACCCCCCCCC